MRSHRSLSLKDRAQLVSFPYRAGLMQPAMAGASCGVMPQEAPGLFEK